MKYIIEVDEELNNVLSINATKRAVSIPTLITDLLKRYVIDAHIMEQNEVWKSGIDECADINLDWANL